MKVFADNLVPDFAISRIVTALKKHAPTNTNFVNSEAEADLVVLYVHGLRRHTWWRAARLLDQNKKYAVVQLNLRSTPNPKTEDWFDVWGNAAVVWSYYDLPKLCLEDGNKVHFNFYHAPLGVDAGVFRETRQERKYIAGIHSKGWSREGFREVVTAARALEKKVLKVMVGVDVYKVE